MFEPDAIIHFACEIPPQQGDETEQHFEPDHADIDIQQDYEPTRD